jgi:DNA repair protein RecN (Recombination protein N)
MLLDLTITEFAIIQRVQLRFGAGLNVLTGQTGAGKSILIDALGAVLGQRVNADMVRTGAKTARVEAVFALDGPRVTAIQNLLADQGIEPDDDQLILSREIQANGRSVARVNGRATTMVALAEIGAGLVDIHGQSDHLSLLKPAVQLNLLDRFAGTLDLRQEVAERQRELVALKHRIAGIATNAREREQRVDMIRFQINEIDSAQLQAGEDEALDQERSMLANAERIQLDTLGALQLLTGDPEQATATGALDQLRQLDRLLRDLAGIVESTAGFQEQVTEALTSLIDLAAEMRTFVDGVENDPARLEEVQDRIEMIRTLKRKYGATIDDILRFGEAAQRELDELTGTGVDIEHLTRERAEREAALFDLASRLSARRKEAATTLSRAIEQSIADLGMGTAKIEFRMTTTPDPNGIGLIGASARVACDDTGIDDVELLVATNAGETPKPVGRIASGGETARLMLGVKSVLTSVDQTPTLVFDEIDVGVGGRSGQVVGEKLAALADTHQVLVITHLPQVAAFADEHFRIEKAATDGRVISTVAPLEPEARTEEIGLMLDGAPLTEAALANATHMLARAERWKQKHAANGALAPKR